jgi:hypothetical protein
MSVAALAATAVATVAVVRERNRALAQAATDSPAAEV